MERRKRQKSSLTEQKQDLKLISKKKSWSVGLFLYLFCMEKLMIVCYLLQTHGCLMIPQKRCFFFVCSFFPALYLLCLLVSILSVISLFFCSVSVCYSLQKKIADFLLHLYLWNELMVKALPIVFVNWQQIWQLMLPKWLGKTSFTTWRITILWECICPLPVLRSFSLPRSVKQVQFLLVFID